MSIGNISNVKHFNFIQRGTKTYFNVLLYADGSTGYSMDDLVQKLNLGITDAELHNKIIVEPDGNIIIQSGKPLTAANTAALLASLNSKYPAFVVATSGIITGTVAGPYAITSGTNDQLKIAIDGGAPISVTLTAGAARTAAQIAADITAQVAGCTVTTNTSGFLVITSNTQGSLSEVNIEAPSSNTAGTTVGLAVSSNNGIAGIQVAK